MNYFLKRVITSLILIFIIYISLKNSLILFLLLMVIAYLSLNEFNLILKKIYKNLFFNYFFSYLFSVIYIFIFILSIWFNLTPLTNLKIVSVIFLLLICVSTDIGGFVFGKIIGGKKLTKISPNKTYSGIVGSFIFSIIFGYLFRNYYNETLIIKSNILILIILISSISQFGDLMISFLKRKAKIKDSGSILPGHGGILDRIDGMLIALPIGLIMISN